MTTRVQENHCLQPHTIRHPLLSTLEKAMLSQAEIKAAARVLDANVCNGQVAEYLLQNVDCRVCGVSDQMEEVRQVRAKLYGGDFAYGAIGDIPWPDNSFDVVLLHPTEGGEDALREQLRECKRVLRAGGQLILGLTCLPRMLQRINRLLWERTEEESPAVPVAQQAMEKHGFESITFTQAGFSSYVLTGWMPKEV